MAPELLTGVAVPPAAAADLYSFGLLAYFIVTGRRPFEGASRDRVLRRLRRGQPPSLAWPVPAADLSRACRPVVEQCTQPRPSLRPTAQQVSDELSSALNPAVGESMDTMLESCTGRSGCGSRKLSFATELSAAGSSDGKEFLEFSGVVEVRQAVSASHRSLMAGTSQSLPVVQEHATLQSREAPGGAEAAPSSSPATAQQATLLHPEYELTPLRTQTLTLAYLLLQGNVAAAPGGSCCWLHSALLALDTAREELQRRPCNVPQSGIVCGQCDTCGLLLTHGQSSCEFCEAPEASSTEADLTHSADVFGI
ncbi:unnamed protein product [Prorocentrum cordatum]|uniref:non-specific serine/threonine protein kinase n=1 Tax=Prorocentrum cordatum TaxID=2364126 RepID=A0ABN9SA73_9DINO|nr:unnamed protein product [Polarella glacialis]